MEIKPLAERPEFLPDLARWYFDQWGHKAEHDSIEKISRRLRGGLNRTSVPIYFVALEDDRPVGSAALKIREMGIHRDKEFWLGDVFVRSDRRGSGIGAALVKGGEELARRLGIGALHLYTPDQEDFYRRLGWVTIDRPRYEQEDVVVMERVLSE